MSSSTQHHNACAIIGDTEDLVTFIQIWEVADTAAQGAWLAVMHDNIGLLRAKAGFISMTLHSSTDGTRIAVYAQWASRAALDDAISDPAAMAAHDLMAQIGTPDGTLYAVDRVYAVEELGDDVAKL